MEQEVVMAHGRRPHGAECSCREFGVTLFRQQPLPSLSNTFASKSDELKSDHCFSTHHRHSVETTFNCDSEASALFSPLQHISFRISFQLKSFHKSVTFSANLLPFQGAKLCFYSGFSEVR